MRAIATVSLSGDLTDKMESAARAGFDGVEIFENDLLSWGGSPEEARALAEELGLSIIALQPFRDFEAMPEPQRTKNFERAARKFALMNALGTDFMLVCSNTAPQCVDDPARAAADLAELADIAAGYGVRIGYEALAWGRHTSDYRDAWSIVKAADHANLGLVLDSFHALALELPVEPIADIPGDKIFLVQLADAPSLDMDVLSWSRHYRNFPGQGRLPVDRFMAALAKTGYDGPLSHEIFNDSFRAAPPRETAVDGMRSLILCESWAEGAPYHTALPDAPAYDGIHFLEFTLDEESAVPLSEWLSALGFRHVGRHRSKNIALWRQGDMHIVLNFETDSFAHTYRLIHGISVCAMGFRVADPAKTMARAAAFKARSYAGPIGDGELQIPALRGIEGSLIYLVDPDTARNRQWSTDFRLFDQPSGAEAGLTRIDHVSHVIAPTQLLSWQLFYKTVFDLEAGREHEMADPKGLIVSQALTSRDRSIRLALNISPADDTQPARFQREHRGGVQQIALATDDIVAAVDAMRDAGLALLEIPDNYYDDLAARIDIDDRMLSALRERSILYDRDEAGEFLHVYTPTFAGAFFFEIVERRGDYDQFGAANAPIRLAAQARAASRAARSRTTSTGGRP